MSATANPMKQAKRGTYGQPLPFKVLRRPDHDDVLVIELLCPRCGRKNHARALQPFGAFDGRMEWSLAWECWCGERIEVASKEVGRHFRKLEAWDDAEWWQP